MTYGRIVATILITLGLIKAESAATTNADIVTSQGLYTAFKKQPSTITFVGPPTLEFRPDGKVFRDGKLITTDKALVEALKKTIEGNCK